MRGVSSAVVLSGFSACLLASQALAGDLDDVRALAREKAAAVSILKAKASNEIATLAQDRIFIAYLNASTQGQGARLRTRMAAMLATLWNRFGLSEVALVDRSGVLAVRVGNTRNAPAGFDVKRDPVLTAGFAQARLTAATVASADALTYAAPVVWRAQAEFVLSGRQELEAYRKVLARGAPADTFVALVDDKGRVLADTRDAPSADKVVAGLSLEAVRRVLKGSRAEGAGEVARGAERFYVSYQAAGEWTIVVGAPAPQPRRCPHAGERLCG
jgi:hypothetical protein